MFVEQNVKNKTAVALITSAVVTAPAAASASAVVDQAVKEIAFSLLLLLLPSSENLRNFRDMTSKVLQNRILIRHLTIPVQNRRQQMFKCSIVSLIIKNVKILGSIW